MRSPRSPNSSARPRLRRRSNLIRIAPAPSPEPRAPSQPAFSRRNLFGRLLRVYGHSMSPVLNPGELVLVREGGYDAREPGRGEIVAARPASLGGRVVVKRITGLPLERVECEGREWTLGPEEFFLMSDRADHGMDSRIFGPVTRRELVGPVWARLWPWKRLSNNMISQISR